MRKYQSTIKSIDLFDAPILMLVSNKSTVNEQCNELFNKVLKQIETINPQPYSYVASTRSESLKRIYELLDLINKYWLESLNNKDMYIKFIESLREFYFFFFKSLK